MTRVGWGVKGAHVMCPENIPLLMRLDWFKKNVFIYLVFFTYNITQQSSEFSELEAKMAFKKVTDFFKLEQRGKATYRHTMSANGRTILFYFLINK